MTPMTKTDLDEMRVVLRRHLPSVGAILIVQVAPDTQGVQVALSFLTGDQCKMGFGDVTTALEWCLGQVAGMKLS